MKNGNGKQIEHRITKLESSMENLGKEINEITTNHLPPLDRKIDSVGRKIEKIVWLLITNLIGLVIGMFYLIIK
jgi:hypothetical protein